MEWSQSRYQPLDSQKRKNSRTARSGWHFSVLQVALYNKEAMNFLFEYFIFLLLAGILKESSALSPAGVKAGPTPGVKPVGDQSYVSSL